MRAIVDATGLPGALRYYRTFRWEPSRTRSLDMSITHIDAINRITLEGVLDKMIAGGKNKGRTTLIVTHGAKNGFIMPLATGGISASKAALKVVMDTSDAIIRANAIQKKTAKDSVRAWTKLANKIAPKAIKGTFTPQEASDWFDNKWVPAQAKRLRLSTASLLSLVKKMKIVRGLAFSRIEIRACNIGADLQSLKAVKGFFGAKKVLAPNVGTFYVSDTPFVSRQRFQVWIRRFGGRVRGGLYRGRQGPSTRSFNLRMAARGSVAASVIRGGFYLRVHEVSRQPSRYGARAAAAEWPHVKAWVDQYIKAQSTYRTGRLEIAGMWTFGQGAQPFVLPAEAAYRAAIVST